MMLFHILMSISDQELMLDKFFLTSSVDLITLCIFKSLTGYTVAPRLLHTPSREETRFLNLNHLSKEFLEQMIPHLKAPI